MRLIHKSKFDGNKSHVLKASLMFVDNNKICDGCDRKAKCASISLLHNGVLIICEDCVRGILESLDPTFERDDKINKILDI